jgi:hypothetical protein
MRRNSVVTHTDTKQAIEKRGVEPAICGNQALARRDYPWV